MKNKNKSVDSKHREVAEECIHILSSMSREFIPLPIETGELITREDMILLTLYICRGMFAYQYNAIGWTIQPNSSHLRNLLSGLQREGYVESTVLYENKRCYTLTRKGYNRCLDTLDKHCMLIGDRRAAVSCLYDGGEYVSVRYGGSNLLHRVLTNDFLLALSSLRPDFPEFIVRHEVAVSDTGNVYVRSYDHDSVCDKQRVKIRIDALFEYGGSRYIYLEQDTAKQSVNVIADKFRNYSDYVFSNAGARFDFTSLSLTFSIFSGMDRMCVADDPAAGGINMSPQLRNLIRRHSGLITGICTGREDIVSVRDLLALMDSRMAAATMYYGSNTASQIRRMFELMDGELSHRTNVASLLTDCMRTERRQSINKDNRDTIIRHYVNRRRIVSRALESCEDIKRYVYAGLTVSCVPNADCRDVLRMTLLSSLPYVSRIIASGIRREHEMSVMQHNGVVLPHVIDAEGIRIAVENISDDLSGRMRITRILQTGISTLAASVICICENIESARAFIKKPEHVRASFERTVTLGDALMRNSCGGIVFLLYPALLSGEFKPFIFIRTRDAFTEYYLNNQG